jgi:hydroxyacylglutathione hydrolase
MRIRYILETHRNEDYVAGSQELAAVTGAAVYHGPWLEWKYGNSLKDGQEIRIGRLNLTAIHTPGHTDESTSYVVTDLSTGKSPVMVFTGDTLFVNDTGRVDLYGLGEIPRMASNLYDSLFNRLLPLGDGVIICPAHGAGSVCGINIADRDESSLGIERMQNPLLKYQDKEIFIRHKAAEHPERPPYFLQMEKYNLEGPPLLHTLPVPPPLSPADFKGEIEKGALVVDTNHPAAFGGAHIKGACSIWLDGLPVFAGWVLPYDKPLLLVLDEPDQLEKAVRHLIRVGYDKIAGFLKGGTEGWYDAGYPVEHLPLLTVQELKDKLDREEDITVLDVRDQDEWKSAHVPGATHIYVGHVEKKFEDIPKEKPVAVMCSVGHRAGVAASILQRIGFPQVYNVLGSMSAWRRAGYPVTTE